MPGRVSRPVLPPPLVTDIARRLDLYADLDPRERAEVDAYVADHPEWTPRLAEARALAALLDAAAPGLQPDAIARLVVDERMDGKESPEAFSDDAELKAEADRIRDRLDTLASEAEDPLAKFERLTGRTLSEAEVRPVRPLGLASVAATRPALRQPSPAPRRLPRWVALAVTALVVGYGGLYAVSAASLSGRDRLADLGDLGAYEAPVYRGADTDVLAARLDAALDGVGRARRSTLGLFPSYDANVLDAVAVEVEAVAAEAEPSSSVSQEARLALGRIRYAQARDAEAARVLGSLVREGSYRGPEARRLLDAIRAQG